MVCMSMALFPSHLHWGFLLSVGVRRAAAAPVSRDVPAPGGVARDLVSSLDPVSNRARQHCARILELSDRFLVPRLVSGNITNALLNIPPVVLGVPDWLACGLHRAPPRFPYDAWHERGETWL